MQFTNSGLVVFNKDLHNLGSWIVQLIEATGKKVQDCWWQMNQWQNVNTCHYRKDGSWHLSVLYTCVYTHTHIYEKWIFPALLQQSWRCKAHLKAFLQERRRDTIHQLSLSRQRCFPPTILCALKPPFYTTHFCSFPKDGKWCTTGSSQDCLTLARESLHTDLSLCGQILHQGSFFRVKGQYRSVGAPLCLFLAVRPSPHSSHPSVVKPCLSQGIRSPAHAFPS